MNPYDQEKLDAIERDRKRREDALLLALLLLSDEARRDAYTMLKYGMSPDAVIRTVMQRGVGTLSLAMADSYRDGVRRMAVLADETVPQSGEALRAWKDENAGTVQTLSIAFRPQAQEAADAMVKSVREAVADKTTFVETTELKAAIREAFDVAGYTLAHPFALNAGVERAIVGAHNQGLFGGATDRPQVITGLRHVSVRDDRTTPICIERDGLMYPLDDPYWISGGIPPLHFGCRSALLPIFGEFTRSERYPVTQPQPGFGYASAVFIRRLRDGGLAA